MCEYPAFYNESLVKARREHRCCETGRTIKRGERYWRINGKWDGDVRTYIQSEAAYHFARYVNGVGDGEKAGSMKRYDPESCIPFGAIRHEIPEDLQDEWKRVCKGEITRCTTTALALSMSLREGAD